ncbi:MAG TPA: HepT-like ribonuclease domain-containing protein [Bryobacteraceae bacterium]|nr:HepT-like ribonuclease domain-containing protein [Bryobacteraceae bacterium]
MPSDNPAQRFDDILDNIERIRLFTAGMDLQSFLEDPKTYDAVERCLERICEAAKKLGTNAEDACPNIPWARIRGLGNFLRHEYDRIEGDRIWFLVERDLPLLRASVQRVIASRR